MGGSWEKGQQVGQQWVPEAQQRCLLTGRETFQWFNNRQSLSTEWTWCKKGNTATILVIPHGKMSLD